MAQAQRNMRGRVRSPGEVGNEGRAAGKGAGLPGTGVDSAGAAPVAPIAPEAQENSTKPLHRLQELRRQTTLEPDWDTFEALVNKIKNGSAVD